MVWTGVVPVTGGGQRAIQSSDDFSGSELAPQWEWNYQPRAEKWSLTERSGWLRLHAFRPLRPDDLLAAGNTLTQRSFQARINTATAKLDLRGMADGQVAGLCHFSKGYSLLGVRQDHGIRQLELRSVGKVLYGPAVRVPWVWLRSTWGEEGLSQYAYSFDGVHFTLWGEPYPLVWSYYRGDRIGLFCWNTLREAGYVDVDFFDYEHSAQRGAGYEGELPAQRK
jgi:beta-xylosidase